MKRLEIWLAVACVAMLVSCPSLLTGQGRVDITVSVNSASNAARTLLPSLLPVSYRASFSGPQPVEPVDLGSDGAGQAVLPFGNWDLTVEGLDAGGLPVASGSDSFLLSASKPDHSSEVRLVALETGRGNVDLTLNWPTTLDPRVASHALSLARHPEGTSVDTGGTVTVDYNTGTLRYAQALDAGSYYLLIKLYRPDGTRYAVYDEALQINGNARSGGTVNLPLSVFNTPASMVIDHGNFDAALSSSDIQAAAALKVYFEHASTGQDIVGNSSTDSRAGKNYDGSQNCGLSELYVVDTRYLCSRLHTLCIEGSLVNDPSWFQTHSGLQSVRRGNPPPATKREMFVGMKAAMRAAVDVAMFKYCWIDVWPETTGYYPDGAAAASADITAMESFISANPGITVVYWTMPLQSNESFAAREAYNSAIRKHCTDNNRWLLDMADIECHNPAGVKQVDGGGREVALADYVLADGGHLSQAGRLRMARAYWKLIAEIARSRP